MFKVFFVPRADKEFAKLPHKLQQKFYTELKRLAENPFLHQQAEKIKGTQFGYRLRIGRWRILFALYSEEKRIEIVDIFLEKGKKDYRRRKRLLK